MDIEEQPVNELSLAEKTNAWIYNYMNHYYLWRDDLPDSLDCNFKLTPTEFFQTLLSNKDRFSYVGFSSRSGNSDTAVPNYGFAYQRMKGIDNKEYLYVLYVSSVQAKSKGISRGDLLFTRDLGKTVASFDIIDQSASNFPALKTVLLEITPSSRNAAKNETVYMDSIYAVENKKIGYLCYLEFNQAGDFYDSMAKFVEAGIDELVLDLRYNPGGYEKTCKTLCNAIVNASAYGNVFVQHSYNEIVSNENFLKYGDKRTYSYFSTPNEEGYGNNIMGEICRLLNLNRVYILVSQHSASCSELTIISLKAYMDVVVIGENSTGKGVGMQVVSVPNFNYELAPITFRFYNALDETVPETGLVPDYFIPDGYSTSKRNLGDIEEPLLQCAIRIITGKLQPNVNWSLNINTGNSLLIPIGEPSFVTEYNQKQK